MHKTGHRYGKYKDTYHLMADSEKELHQFATQMGLKREWFQNSIIIPHYDVFGAMTDKAYALGAKDVTSRLQLMKLIKRYKSS